MFPEQLLETIAKTDSVITGKSWFFQVPWHVPCKGACYGDGNLVFIANDWHTALLPMYLKVYYRDNGLMSFTRSVLVIHKIAHQGLVEDFYHVDFLEHYMDLFKLYEPVEGDYFNIFTVGLKTTDIVVTISHGYVREHKISKYGWDLHGIINESIVQGNLTKKAWATSSRRCPTDWFYWETGSPKDNSLDDGPGCAINHVRHWQTDLEEMLSVREWVRFFVNTAYRITVGVDILLMPSRFEPCGLNQMYAMNYRTILVVHAINGMKDIVQPFKAFEKSELGGTFDSADANKLIHALGNCLLTYRK
ncbi:Starch synthase [Theobroma cacao]|nr:Starch synthase [Theobroma cacao]